MLIDHDMHVHTLLSACSSDIKNIPENILKRAAEVGLNNRICRSYVGQQH